MLILRAKGSSEELQVSEVYKAILRTKRTHVISLGGLLGTDQRHMYICFGTTLWKPASNNELFFCSLNTV